MPENIAGKLASLNLRFKRRGLRFNRRGLRFKRRGLLRAKHRTTLALSGQVSEFSPSAKTSRFRLRKRLGRLWSAKFANRRVYAE